ncbi:MAG: flagellin lysine-N-methylase [Telluria sp.]
MPILHLTRTLPAVLPRYVSRFRCIGSQCEDTCCSGWQVTLDKKTFNAYRQSKHPDLVKPFAASIKRQRSMANELNYGKIELSGPHNTCPLIEKDGLCGVQNKLDESYLSNTCFTYPRVSRAFAGQFEQALMLSCPEAARQALLAPDAFEFEEGTITVRADMLNKVTARHGITVEHMNEVRIFCLNLMNTRDLELWQRLAVMGVFCESLTRLIAAGQQGAIPGLIADFHATLAQGELVDALRDIQPNHAAQAYVFSTLWGGKTLHGSTVRQVRLIASIAKNLGADPDTGITTAEQLLESYMRGLGRLQQVLEGAPHLFENFVLNEMFSHLFPFDAGDPYEHYLQLVSRFGLLRLMLAAQCNTEGELPGIDVLIQTTQVFCRRFEHDIAFAGKVNAALASSGWGSLDKLYSFLRA